METISSLQIFLSQYPLLEAVLAHIEPVEFVNLQLAGISMPIKKKAAVEKMIKKCQNSDCVTTNESETLITCARIFKLPGPAAPECPIYIPLPPTIPHPPMEWQLKSKLPLQGQEYICRKHMILDLAIIEPYPIYAWDPVCSHHSSEFSTDLSKRSLPPACFCLTEREKREWSCFGCRRYTNHLLNLHYSANSKAKYEEIKRSLAARDGVTDPKELALCAPGENRSNPHVPERNRRGAKLARICPVPGCEEEALWKRVDGQLHVMYCTACQSFFQIDRCPEEAWLQDHGD